MFAPAVKDTESAVDATDARVAVLSMAEMIGDPGTAAGVLLNESVADPLPIALTARTRTE